MSNGLETCPMRIPAMVFSEQRGYPNHVKEILTWIDGNRPEFDGLIQSFDKAVGMFNELGTDDFRQSYQNFHMVKGILNGVSLPTVGSLIFQGQEHPGENGIWLPLLYARTLKRVSIMMKRGDQKKAVETTGEQVDGPTIGYQNTATDTRTLVIASIFQVYEEVIKSLPEFRGRDFEPDRIIEALMEVSTEDLQLTQTLFKPLTSREGMNWVEGSDRFSPEFKKASLGLIR